jgi:proteasome beta subunit
MSREEANEVLQGGYEGSSFYDLLQHDFPHLLPFQHLPQLPAGELQALRATPLATTILALRFAAGVVVAGDRQATEGFEISSRRIEKVHNADEHAVIAIAGAAGPCLEMVKIFQVEMEHYQKIEGEILALDGKANRLAQMVRQNLPAAFQGLVVVPIFAGYDMRTQEGRIFKYDLTGGRYEEHEYYATGSGGKEARGTLKKRYRTGLTRDQAIRLAVEALVDAADLDVGTSGPDLARGIYPQVKVVTRDGIADVNSEELRPISEEFLAMLKG